MKKDNILRALLLISLLLISSVATAQTTSFAELSGYLPKAPDGWEVEILDESAVAGGVLASANYFNDEDFFVISLMADNPIEMLMDFKKAESAPQIISVRNVIMGDRGVEISGVFGNVAVTGIPGEASRDILLETLETIDYDALSGVGR